MKNLLIVTSCLLVLTGLAGGCSKKQRNTTDVFERDNLVAWCVVPFDTQERTPEERADMLDNLGFRQLAYDWRERHIASFPEEIKVLKKHNISLAAVWLWIGGDTVFSLGPQNEQIIQTVRDAGISTDFWVGFDDGYFSNAPEEVKMERALTAVTHLATIAAEIGCTVSLYNHGGWLGEPENQVRIIRKGEFANVGIVYNFHHGHHHVQRFDTLMQLMLPYVRTINLNGMTSEQEKILPLGTGKHELEMMRIIKASGYEGLIGIIGHVDTDIEPVLRGNLEGLEQLRGQL
jgi:hypothetical protein